MPKSAGAILLAGFIEAPDIGPIKIAIKATTAPIEIPAINPFSLEPVETFKSNVVATINVLELARKNFRLFQTAKNNDYGQFFGILVFKI